MKRSFMVGLIYYVRIIVLVKKKLFALQQKKKKHNPCSPDQENLV